MGFKPFLYLIGMFLIAACSSGSMQTPQVSIVETEPPQKTGTGEPVQGSINGQDWMFISGRAYYKKSQPNFLIMQLWNMPYSLPCEEKMGSVLQMRITAPNQVATWTITPEDPFNANLSIFFTDLNWYFHPWDNMRADIGEVRLLSIDKNSVSGVVSGSFQNTRAGVTQVKGDFTVPVCP